MARSGVSGFAVSLHNAIVVPYILNYGSEEQKKRWLPKMATGEMIGAIAMSEPGAGSGVQGIKTSARLDGNHYIINGQKTFISNGQLADLVIVVAKTDPSRGAKGTSLIVVETDGSKDFIADATSRKSAWRRRTLPSSSSTTSASDVNLLGSQAGRASCN